ncbi:hypothetical protein DFP72DRAFT_843838 [Ephemerocybe angulata]|uniref:Uncharacterized protein n=1 Tax=Ephemerocybe angulata TaxID=980116 RepID=A0A8H6M997_9AGAR|nr:hypothetical protein DFP72DRAFT_843838 [Tulosesus angulatus]
MSFNVYLIDFAVNDTRHFSTEGYRTVADFEDALQKRVYSLANSLPPFDARRFPEYDCEAQVLTMVDWLLATYMRVRLWHSAEEKTFWKLFRKVLHLWADTPFMRNLPSPYKLLKQRIQENYLNVHSLPYPSSRLEGSWKCDLSLAFHAECRTRNGELGR